jgi:hypothetical protein
VSDCISLTFIYQFVKSMALPTDVLCRRKAESDCVVTHVDVKICVNRWSIPAPNFCSNNCKVSLNGALVNKIKMSVSFKVVFCTRGSQYISHKWI